MKSPDAPSENTLTLSPSLMAHVRESATNTITDKAASCADTAEISSASHIGRFQVIEKIGEGAFGAVYRAVDAELQREVAIKLPHDLGGASSKFLDRQLREARALAAFRHANICPIYEVGTLNGKPFIVMAFIKGEPLEQLLKRRGALSAEEVGQLTRTLALALSEAHRHGIVHRDLKPANVMMDEKLQPVILDFGLARRLSSDDVQLTKAGELLGTPLYMSPEQVRGDVSEVGPKSDIYSLGVMMYRLLCGQLPFSGRLTQVLTSISSTEPAPPRTHFAAVDPTLEAICLKAMAKKPQDRFDSMDDFAAALQTFGTGHSSSAAAEANPSAVATPSRISTTRLLAIAAAVLVVGMLTFPFMRPTEPESRGTRSSGPGLASVRPSDPNESNKTAAVAALNQQANVPKLTAVVKFHLQRASEKTGFRVLTAADLPVRDNDKVQIYVELNRPGFISLYWYDANGMPNRLWPKDHSQSVKTSALWEPPLAPAGELQTWHVVGGDFGPELIIAAVSESELTAQQVADFESSSIRYAQVNAEGQLVDLSPNPERGPVGTVKTVKTPNSTLRPIVILPDQYDRKVISLRSGQSGLSPQDATTTLPLDAKHSERPFETILQKAFSSYDGIVFPHR